MIKRREEKVVDKALPRKGKYTKLVLTKEGDLLFQEDGKTLKLTEVNTNGQNFKAPYSISDAKKVANAKGIFLSIRK